MYRLRSVADSDTLHQFWTSVESYETCISQKLIFIQGPLESTIFYDLDKYFRSYGNINKI